MVVCLCTKPIYLKGTWIHDAYFSVYARKDNGTPKWFFPLFLSCPTNIAGTTASTVTLTFANGEVRTFWYYTGLDDSETALNGSSAAPKPIPTFMPPKPCTIHRTLSSSEHLAKMKKRHAFQTAHSNVYARCPMGYTDCFNTYNSSRRMCIEE